LQLCANPILRSSVNQQLDLHCALGRWLRSPQSSQTMNEGAPGPLALGPRDASNLDSCDLNHDVPVSPENAFVAGSDSRFTPIAEC
jgi:hypothetical protein